MENFGVFFLYNEVIRRAFHLFIFIRSGFFGTKGRKKERKENITLDRSRLVDSFFLFWCICYTVQLLIVHVHEISVKVFLLLSSLLLLLLLATFIFLC